MLIREHTWGQKSEPSLRRMFEGMSTVITCDPDASGAIVLWQAGRFVDARSLTDPNALRWISDTAKLKLNGRVTLVIEAVFSRNKLSSLTMARRAGYVVGAVALCAPLGVEMVQVWASTWQNWTLRELDASPTKASEKTRPMRSDAVRAAYDAFCERAVPGWSGFDDKRAEGMRCAVGIGHWWLKEVARCWS